MSQIRQIVYIAEFTVTIFFFHLSRNQRLTQMEKEKLTRRFSHRKSPAFIFRPRKMASGRRSSGAKTGRKTSSIRNECTRLLLSRALNEQHLDILTIFT